MTEENFGRLLRGFLGRKAFLPFTIELNNGSRIEVNHPEALSLHGGLIRFRSTRGIQTIFEADAVSRFIDAT
jgi:hypothetical protein